MLSTAESCRVDKLELNRIDLRHNNPLVQFIIIITGRLPVDNKRLPVQNKRLSVENKILPVQNKRLPVEQLQTSERLKSNS